MGTPWCAGRAAPGTGRARQPRAPRCGGAGQLVPLTMCGPGWCLPRCPRHVWCMCMLYSIHARCSVPGEASVLGSGVAGHEACNVEKGRVPANEAR